MRCGGNNQKNRPLRGVFPSPSRRSAGQSAVIWTDKRMDGMQCVGSDTDGQLLSDGVRSGA